MVSFRKMSMAFAGCVLMGASVASAQTAIPCDAPVAPYDTLRQEALTQLIGDVTVTCHVPAAKAAVAGGTADITIESDGGFVFTNTIDEDSNVEAAVTLDVAGTAAGQGVLASDGKSITWTGAVLDDLLDVTVAAADRVITIHGLKINANMVASGSIPKVRVVLIPYDTGGDRVTVSSTLGEVGRVQAAVAFSADNEKTIDCTGAAAPSTAQADVAKLAYIQFAENYSRAFVIGDKLTARFKVPAGAKLYVFSNVYDFENKVYVVDGAGTPSVDYGAAAENTFVEVKADDDGIYQAVWTIEGVTTSKDKFMIPFYVTSSAGAVVSGTITAVGSLGPFSTVATATDDADVPAVRFVVPTDATDAIYTFTNCTQVLLFPYATNVGNWDTGIAISNISADMKDADGEWASGGDDPKSGQKGTCTLYFVGDKAPEKAIETEEVAAGKTLAFMVSSKVEGFNGYLKVKCDFSAKGMAFMSSSDLGGVGVGYLAQEGVALVQ